jgi:hypothetical protein
VIAWLPTRLPNAKWDPLWKKRTTNSGVGGIAASTDYVVFSDRDTKDGYDVWRCQKLTDGADVWTLRYPAPGELDYGNSPRATPTLTDNHAYLLGAMGDLHCVELATGKVVWKRQLLKEFQVTEKQVWGFAASPILVDNLLIVNPGAKQASLVALDPSTGKTVWQTPGEPAAFASFILRKSGTHTQLIGYDKLSLGGWNPTTGTRLWSCIPPDGDDFNVPTPILWRDQLLVSTENNGTRLYAFDDKQQLVTKPTAHNKDLAPDTHTPVLVGDRLYGVWHDLLCLDTTQGLREVSKFSDPVCKHYATLIASTERLLLVTQFGELLLFDITQPELKLLDRIKLTTEEVDVYAHPAIVGQRLVIRIDRELRCYELPVTK